MNSLQACLTDLDLDATRARTVALSITMQEQEAELPMHRHRKGQLVIALRGGVVCKAQGGLWMVPPGSGVWIPGDVMHSNHVTANGRICLFFVEPDVPGLPGVCCTLSLTPMVIEMVKHLARYPQQDDTPDPQLELVAEVVLGELRKAEIAALHLPIPDDPALTKIANALVADPADRSSMAEWAERVAMSERSLARLVSNKTAMSFGRWRQQLHIIVALQRLASGLSVQRVSDELGYESVSAFITMFKKALGQSPARYIAAKERSLADAL